MGVHAAQRCSFGSRSHKQSFKSFHPKRSCQERADPRIHTYTFFFLWRKALVPPNFGRASCCSQQSILQAPWQRLPRRYPESSMAAKGPWGRAAAGASGWGIPGRAAALGSPAGEGGSAPGPAGTLEMEGVTGSPPPPAVGRCQLRWFFPFCFHSFCMFHVLRAERMERGREKLRSCEERPTYPPTGGKSILRSQPLCEKKKKKQPQTLVPEHYINPHEWPVAGRAMGRAAEARPVGDAQLEQPLLQSQLREAIVFIYLHPTFLATLF